MKNRMQFPDDGFLHDLAGAGQKREIRFFRHWLQGSKGTVLEIGAGTGRITLPLLEDGHRVTAMEPDAGLLTWLADRAGTLPLQMQKKLTLWHTHLPDAGMADHFPRIILPGNHLCRFTRDGELQQALENVRQLLTPRGRGMLAVFHPDPARLTPVPGWQHRLTREAEGMLIRRHDRRSYDRWNQVLTTEIRWSFSAGEQTRERTWVLQHRVFFPRELPVILARAGLKVTGTLGDWDGRSPATDTANQLIEFSRGRTSS